MKQPKNLAILVDDEEYVRDSTKQALNLQEIEVNTFARANRAVTTISRQFPGVIISDIRMPDMNGIELLQTIQDIDVEIPVILITGHGDVAQAVSAMQLGAYDYIEKPFSTGHLTKVSKKAIQFRQLVLEKRGLEENLNVSDPLELILVGHSVLMENLRKEVSALSASDVNVLISGETGTGKELVARTIHEKSNLNSGPFCAINLASLPELSIESELFGHEVGAFSGAIKTRYGLLEHARNGTLFLDKIESAPLHVQAKILRVIEQKSFLRLGGGERIPLDARIIASSNTDLDVLVIDGQFRKDLLYRISVVKLSIPPLRERKEDIPRLFQHIVKLSAIRLKKDIPEANAEILSELIALSWEGNVRELRNAAERHVMGFDVFENTENQISNTSLAEQIHQFEKSTIAQALTQNKGDLKRTYAALDISRKTLYEKMHKYNLDKDYFKV